MGGSIDAELALPLARAAAACAGPRPRSGPDPLGTALEAVVDAAPPGAERRALVHDLAEHRPDLVLRRAPDWVSGDDVELLVRLPQHWFRVAVAGSLRPWSRRSMAEVLRVLDDGADVIARVMADAYPELTRPADVPDEPGRRWRAIGGEVWEWSLWERDDGRFALEVEVSSGLAEFAIGELVDEALVDAWRREGPAALDAELDRVRRRRLGLEPRTAPP